MSSTWLAVTGLMVSSTGSALLRKVLFQLKGVGLQRNVHPWEKPWFSTFESVAACWLCLLILYGHKAWKARAATAAPQSAPSEQQALLGDAEDTFEIPSAGEAKGAAETGGVAEQVHVASWREIGVLGWPGAFSVISITVQGLGLKYISASLSMMLSGSCIVFTAVLSVLILRCRLNKLHFIGIALSLVGIMVVSSANLIWPPPDNNTHNANLGVWGGLLGGGALDGIKPAAGAAETALGIVLTMLAMLILAGRLVAEELVLTGTELHPLQVLGYEGMWGTVGIALLGLPLAWILPGNDIGHCQENPIDSVVMLWQNPGINAVNVVFFLSVVGLNVFGLMVTRTLGSVFRAVLLTARTASVWAVDLILFKMHVGDGTVGEPWGNPSSWIQLFGFALLLLGTIMYAQGSSYVALYEESKVAEDTEGREPSYRSLARPSAVTRLRPYTSLYIPQGPRYDTRAELLRRASHSLPRDGPPVERPGALFHSQSYTPGMMLSGAGYTSSSASVDRLLGVSPNRSLFLKTLTHRSSWVLSQFQAPPWASSEEEGDQAEAEGANGAQEREAEEAGTDEACNSRWHDEPSSPRPNPFAALSTAALPDIGSEPARPPAPAMGQSPATDLVLQSRASARKPLSQLPQLSEADEADTEPDAPAAPRQPSQALSTPAERPTSVTGQSPAPELVLQSRASARKPLTRLPSLSEAEEAAGVLPAVDDETVSQSSIHEASQRSAQASHQPPHSQPTRKKSSRGANSSQTTSGTGSSSGGGSSESISSTRKGLLQRGLSTEKSLGRPLSLRTRASSGLSVSDAGSSNPGSASSVSQAKKPYPGADALHKARWWQSQSEPWDGGSEEPKLRNSGSIVSEASSFSGGNTQSPEALQQAAREESGSSAGHSRGPSYGSSAEQGQDVRLGRLSSAEASGSEGHRVATPQKEAEKIAAKTGALARGAASKKFLGQSPTPTVLAQQQAQAAAAKPQKTLTPFAEEDAGWNSESDSASIDTSAALPELTPSRSGSVSIPLADIQEHGGPSNGQRDVSGSSEVPPMGGKAPMGQSPTPQIVLARRASARSTKSAALPALSEEEEETFDESVGSRSRNGHSQGASKGGPGYTSDSGSSSSSRVMMGQSPTPARVLERRATAERGLSVMPAFQESAEGSEAASNASYAAMGGQPLQETFSETCIGSETLDDGGDYYPASDSGSEGGSWRRRRGNDSGQESDSDGQEGGSDDDVEDMRRRQTSMRRASTGAREEQARLPRDKASSTSLQSWGGAPMSL